MTEKEQIGQTTENSPFLSEYPRYQTTPQEERRQAAQLQLKRTYRLVRTKLLGERIPGFNQRIGHHMDSFVFGFERNKESLNLVGGILQQVLLERSASESEGNIVNRPLSTIFTTSDEAGQNYTTTRQLSGTQLEKHVFQDKTTLRGGYDCIRVLLPKDQVHKEELYLLQLPDPGVKDIHALELLIHAIDQAVPQDDSHDRYTDRSRVGYLLSDLERLKGTQNQEQLLRSFKQLSLSVVSWLKNTSIEKYSSIEGIINLITQEDLWVPRPGTLVATSITNQTIIQAHSHDGYSAIDNRVSVEAVTTREYDQTVTKEKMIALTQTLRGQDGLHTGYLSDYLLPFIIKHSRLNILMRANADSAKGKRVERQQQSLQLANSSV